MSSINQTKKPLDTSHTNWDGGKSFDINNPLTRLRVAASSCFFGEPQYYHPEGEKTARHSTLAPKEISYIRETLNAIDPQEWRGLSASNLMETAIDAALDHDAEA